jgi:signal peptidase II
LNPEPSAETKPEPGKQTFSRQVFWVAAAVIAVDQVTKIIVLNTMQRGESIRILGDWLRFTFTENPGMAFGIEYGPPVIITAFSILATVLIVLYLRKVGYLYKPYRISLSLVLGGAIGNIIDRVFYGMILYDAPPFMGRVVDFIHINVWRGYVSDSVPVLGGKFLALFPIWNVADMAIVAGVAGILIFQRRFHDLMAARENADSADASEAVEVGMDPTTLPGAEIPVTEGVEHPNGPEAGPADLP